MQHPASRNNIWWYPFLVINNLPQNQKVPTVLRTVFLFPANSCFLNLPGVFLSVCFSSICLIYEFINFPRTFASSTICLCFSNRKWNQDWWMMPIVKTLLTAEKCFLEKSWVLPPVFSVLKTVFCEDLGKSPPSTPLLYNMGIMCYIAWKKPQLKVESLMIGMKTVLAEPDLGPLRFSQISFWCPVHDSQQF